MSSVIIDNSTLKAIQRLCGTAPAPSSYDAQGDYAALENFFLALLFHDDLYFIDDYKEEYKQARRSEFKYIRPVPEHSFPYEGCVQFARLTTNDLFLEIRAGRVQPGLVKEFLESIGLYLTAAWHLQSSDYYLVLKILADGGDELKYKYSPLSAMIFSELTGERTTEVEDVWSLVDSSGQPIPKRHERGDTIYVVGSEVRRFAAALNWLSFRTAFYAISASGLAAQMSLHPIRHNFLARWVERTQFADTTSGWRHSLSDFFGMKAAETINAINNDLERQVIGFELPLMAAWAVGKTGTVTDGISFILDLRQGPSIASLRSKLNELEHLRTTGNVEHFKKDANRLRAAIEQEASLLQRKYGFGQPSRPSVSITAEILPIPKFSVTGSFDVKVPSALASTRHMRALLRNVVEDVVGFDHLGSIRSDLLRQVKRSKEFSQVTLRVEDRRYFGGHTDWKQPM